MYKTVHCIIIYIYMYIAALALQRSCMLYLLVLVQCHNIIIHKLYLYIVHVKIHMYIYPVCWCAGVWAYIEATRDAVRDLERRVRLAKANVAHMTSIMAGWRETPLYQRREERKDPLLLLDVSCKCACIRVALRTM